MLLKSARVKLQAHVIKPGSWIPPPVTPHLHPCRQREVYKEPEIDRPALILEMLLHVTFLMLMTYACMSKRIIAEAFYLYQAP